MFSHATQPHQIYSFLCNVYCYAPTPLISIDKWPWRYCEFTLFYGTRCLAWSWLMFWPDCTFFTTIMKAHPINQDAVSVRWQLWGEFLKLQWILLWSIPFIVLLVTLLTSFFNVFCTSPVSTDSYSAMLTNMLTNPTSPMFYCLPSTYLSNPIFFYKYWPKSCTTPACSYLVITTIQPRTS